MKGDTATSKRALSPLRGRLAKIEAVQLPGIPDPHYLFVIEKTH